MRGPEIAVPDRPKPSGSTDHVLLSKVVVQTKRHAAVEAQPNPQPVSNVFRLHANCMLRGGLACYGNEGAGDLRAVRVAGLPNESTATGSGASMEIVYHRISSAELLIALESVHYTRRTRRASQNAMHLRDASRHYGAVGGIRKIRGVLLACPRHAPVVG